MVQSRQSGHTDQLRYNLLPYLGKMTPETETHYCIIIHIVNFYDLTKLIKYFAIV